MKSMIKTQALTALTALVLSLSGCGLNDNPYPAATLNPVWPTSGGYQSLMAGPTDPDLPVLTVVVGAVVITHTDQPYLDGSTVTSTQQVDFEDDLLNSASYFTVSRLSLVGSSISFQIPPPAAGPNWQIFAVGVQYSGDTLTDVAGGACFNDARVRVERLPPEA